MIKILLSIAIVGSIFKNIEYVMENIFFIITVFFIAYTVLGKLRKNRQKQFIANYHFPEELDEKISSAYPHLSIENLVDVQKELKHFFEMTNACRPGVVAIPSRVVDVAWYEFTLHTNDYHQFCDQAFGHYLHHNIFSKKMLSKDIKVSLQRAWVYSCRAENINPQNPFCLPVLFSIDSSLNISDGNKFSVESVDELTENYSSNSNGSLKCVSGSFAKLGAVTLVSHVGSDSDGGGGGSGGGCGGGCGGG